MILLFFRGGGSAPKEQPYPFLFVHQDEVRRKLIAKERQAIKAEEAALKAAQEAKEWADEQERLAKEAAKPKEFSAEEMAGFTALARAMILAEIQAAKDARDKLQARLAEIEAQRIELERTLLSLWIAKQDEEAAIILLLS